MIRSGISTTLIAAVLLSLSAPGSALASYAIYVGKNLTEDGSVLHAGRTPAHDATAVAMLRAAGAVILGKTVTAELGGSEPGPHQPV